LVNFCESYSKDKKVDVFLEDGVYTRKDYSSTASSIVVVILQVKVWVKELRKMLGNDITLCIAGNKLDLEKERHVTVDEAETYVITIAVTAA